MSGWGARRMMVIVMEAYVATMWKGRIVEMVKGRTSCVWRHDQACGHLIGSSEMVWDKRVDLPSDFRAG